MNYKLKKGAVIHLFGPQCSPVTNENLTEDSIELLIERGFEDQLEEVDEEEKTPDQMTKTELQTLCTSLEIEFSVNETKAMLLAKVLEVPKALEA